MTAPHDDAMLDLVAIYAVGGVEASECAAVREHLAQCEICRTEFKSARAAADALALSAEETPPAGLRARVLSALPPQAAVSTVGTLQPKRRMGWLIPAVTAAAVIAVASVIWTSHRTAPQGWAAVCAPAASGCHAVGWLTSAGPAHMRLEINGLAKLPPGREYQAWLILAGGAPKPEPTFSADQRGAGSVDIPEAVVKGAVVAITVEPAGGSRAPTSKPFLIAKIE